MSKFDWCKNKNNLANVSAVCSIWHCCDVSAHAYGMLCYYSWYVCVNNYVMANL